MNLKYKNEKQLFQGYFFLARPLTLASLLWVVFGVFLPPQLDFFYISNKHIVLLFLIFRLKLACFREDVQ